MVGPTIIVGFGTGPNQVSLLTLHDVTKLPFRTLLTSTQEQKLQFQPLRLHQHFSAKADKVRSGVTCLAPVSFDGQGETETLRFISGGYDKTVNLWVVDLDEDSENVNLSARAEPLATLKSAALAILYRSWNQSMICAASKWITVGDVQRDGVTRLEKISDITHHIHESTAHKLTIFEVGRNPWHTLNSLINLL